MPQPSSASAWTDRARRRHRPWAALPMAVLLTTVLIVLPTPPATAEPPGAPEPTPTSFFDQPNALVSGPDGALWFLAGASIGRLTTDGGLTTFPLQLREGPADLTFGTDGNLWFAGPARLVGRMTPNGEATYFSTGISRSATAITASSDGSIWYGATDGRVGEVSSTGRVTEHVLPSPGGGNTDEVTVDMVADTDGSIWLTTSGSRGEYSAVVHLSSAGDLLGRVVECRAYHFGEFGNFVRHLTADPAGGIWYQRQEEGSPGSAARVIGHVSSDGAKNEWDVDEQWISGPRGELTLDRDGRVWFTDSQRIGRLSADGDTETFDVGQADSQSIVYGPGGDLWFTDALGIRRATTDGELVSRYASPSPAPRGLKGAGRPGAILASWTGGSSLGDYTVTVEPGRPSIEVHGTRSVITGLTNGVTYSIAVRAREASGVGLPSRVRVTPQPARAVAFASNFIGDEHDDLAVYRPSTGTWWIRGGPTVQYGAATDVPVPADYNGDGRTDIAVWRPSTGRWHIRGRTSVAWGVRGDIPVLGDFDGDRRADLAVWRPSSGRWYVRGRAPVRYGVPGDIPVAGDFTGDRRTELAVWRPTTGTWYVWSQVPKRYGTAGDVPVLMDGNQDGRTDIAVFRPATGNWHLAWSSQTVNVHFPSGSSDAVPVPGNLYGSRASEAAVFFPWSGSWWSFNLRPQSIDEVRREVCCWGANGDLPV